LRLAPSINIFHGDNGSGKTSFLEAVSLLGLGRSFRSSRARSVINHHAERCEIFGQVERTQGGIVPVGISRTRAGAREIRIGGEAVAQVAALSRMIPLQLINTDSIGLLSGPPDLRRRFLNWGVFHVEQEFHTQWRRYQHCLRQRNALLRGGKMDRAQLQAWNGELAGSGELIDRYRDEYMNRLQPRFRAALGAIFPAAGVELGYRRGWDREAGLEQLLEREIDRDLARGFTQDGPHRAELLVTTDGRPAAETLSRGELKLVASALMVAQVTLLNESGSRECIYLIDDLASELDLSYRRRLCNLIQAGGNQVLVTSVTRESLEGCWTRESPRMFHVEHGRIDPEEQE
jgi:DNA replication and repair protein RecF